MGVGLTASVGVFCAATLIGGATLLPTGVGATGSVIILQLENLGLPLSDGVMVVSLVCLATSGAALAVGAMFLTLELRNLRP